MIYKASIILVGNFAIFCAMVCNIDHMSLRGKSICMIAFAMITLAAGLYSTKRYEDNVNNVELGRAFVNSSELICVHEGVDIAVDNRSFVLINGTLSDIGGSMDIPLRDCRKF